MQQSITAQGDLGLIINECIARHNARPSKAQLIVGLPPYPPARPTGPKA